MVDYSVTLGATFLGGGRCRFLVWAPLVERLEVHLVAPEDRFLPMKKDAQGYYSVTAENVEPGGRYFYRLNGEKERPDPASRFQPEGVHGPSEVVDPGFPWEDGGWFTMLPQELVFYELHVGTFTPEGTFDAIAPYLDGLKKLGVTAIELMPIAQFPGNRNWGYDGAYPFAAQSSYGGSPGLKRLVSACHQKGLAVALDVSYNHFGPEGSYIREFAPYFTEHYKTPWGAAINYGGPYSDDVRRFFIESALYWVVNCHIDILRLDAVHTIVDSSPYPFLQELADTVHEQAAKLGRRVYGIAESDLNDRRLLLPAELGGYGMDGVWNEDFHHALHPLVTGESSGYYGDFGGAQRLAKACREGFIYTGQYSIQRKQRHGSPSRDIPASRFVVFIQNHDQVGNRMIGDRLSSLVPFEKLKLAAGAYLLSPYIPLIFMGEEYGETAPFPYFISHTEPELVESVRRGRRKEFAAFGWKENVPDPQAEESFRAAKLNHTLANEGWHGVLRRFYQELLRLRREVPALACLSKDSLEAIGYERTGHLFMRRWSGDSEVILVFNFGTGNAPVTLPLPQGRWEKRLDSAGAEWQGPGSHAKALLNTQGEVALAVSPGSFVMFARTG